MHNPSGGAVPGHVSSTDDSCFGSGCHASSKELNDVHALYVGPGSERPEYESTCALCHENPSVDVAAAASLGCAPACHDVTAHSGMVAAHTVTASSAECTACHGSSLEEVHGASVPGAECATCHGNDWNWAKSGDCVACHNGVDVGSQAYSPVDPQPLR